MWCQRGLLIALLAGVLLASAAGVGAGGDAQAANATVSGTVTWANGTPVADATVRALGGESVTVETQTDSGGSYELSAPPGEYTVVVFADGESSEPRAVGLDAGERLSLDAQLSDENAPPPDDANVTGRVQKIVRNAAAGSTVDLRFSSAEERAVGVRRLSVSFRTAVNETAVSVADVDGGRVDPPGEAIRLLYLDADDRNAVSGMSVLLRVEQAAIGEGEFSVYQYRGGSWESIESQRVVSTSETLLLRVDVSGLGYVAAVTETTTTTATPWISTGTPHERERLAGSGLRTGLGLVALAAAVALAVRGSLR